MSAFTAHLCLSAAKLKDSATAALDADVLAPGVALELTALDTTDTLAECHSDLKTRGFPVRAVSMRWDLRRPPDAASLGRWLTAIGLMCDLLLLRLESSDIHDKPSAPRAMPAAAQLLQLSSKLAGQQVRIALTPSPGSWLADEHDAVRLAMRVNRANVGVAMNWTANREGQDPSPDLLRLVAPKLLAVILRGEGASGRGEEIALDALLKPLSSLGCRVPVFLHE